MEGPGFRAKVPLIQGHPHLCLHRVSGAVADYGIAGRLGPRFLVFYRVCLGRSPRRHGGSRVSGLCYGLGEV